MKNLQEIVRGIEQKLGKDKELHLIDGSESIDVTGSFDAGYWVKNTFEPNKSENNYGVKLLAKTISAVHPLEGKLDLQELDLHVYHNGKEVGFEKFDSYEGENLNPTGDLMSRYAFEHLSNKGIDILCDVCKEGDLKPGFSADTNIVSSFGKSYGVETLSLFGVSFDDGAVEVHNDKDFGQYCFPAEQRLERIMSVYNSLLNQE